MIIIVNFTLIKFFRYFIFTITFNIVKVTCRRAHMQSYLKYIRVGVGTQLTLGGHNFPRKYMYEKLTECPTFT